MHWREVLAERGFARIHLGSSEELLAVADELGAAIRLRPDADLVQQLRPTSKREARPRSLSGLHGVDAFPFHTDGAHQPEPPRYLVMRCVRPGAAGRATLVADATKLALEASDLAAIRRAVFIVDGGGTARPFLASILTETKDHGRQLRFDPGCMRPAHPRFAAAGTLLSDALNKSPAEVIRWRANDGLVVDNHRCAHARAAAVLPDNDRLLQRVTVAEL